MHLTHTFRLSREKKRQGSKTRPDVLTIASPGPTDAEASPEKTDGDQSQAEVSSPTPEVASPKKSDSSEKAPNTKPLTVAVASSPSCYEQRVGRPPPHSGSSSVGAATASSSASPPISSSGVYEQTLSPPPQTPAVTTATTPVPPSGIDWKMESRLRPTTLLVTAATESAANVRSEKSRTNSEGSKTSNVSSPVVSAQYLLIARIFY